MKTKTFFFLLLLLFYSSNFFGQKLWTKITSRDVANSEILNRTTNPSSYQLFALDFIQLKQQLQTAPLYNLSTNNPKIISFPDSDGKILNFTVCEAPIMEQGLQVKFPHLKSYTAKGIDNPRTTLRFSITDFGLHAMSVTNEKGTYFIDSYTKDSNKYILYYKKHCTSNNEFICHSKAESFPVKAKNNNIAKLLSNDGLFRQYRMAMTAASDYSQFHIDAAGVTNGTLLQKKSAVLSALVVTMTRINGIYERDLGIRMNLVANNDLLILIGPESFQFTEANILNENILLTDTTIGHENYDIGHVVCTIGYNMGVPALCAFDKAAGTTGSYTPVGDPFDIDFVAHEVGHQFGAGHTFYSSCDDQADDSVSVEPGSGSTIMSYAGICDPSVQNHSDAYFTTATIQQIQAFINNPDHNCGAATPSNSVTPTITPLNNYKIPFGTPFVLRGNATAPNPNLLTYCWEQTDIDSPYENPQPQPPLNTNTLGPNFRSFFPTYSPDRYMPNFTSVLEGKLYKKWEVISNVARTMNFGLTVRDNNLINGGQTQTAQTSIEVAAVGPFKITSLTQTNASFPFGISHNLTWDVAGTTANGINTSTVTILISTDSGVTFTPLVSNTPNDGIETIQFPNVESAYCRIMITADNSIYYAVSPNFSLGYQITTTCATYTDNQPIPVTYNNGGFVTKIINVPTAGIVGDLNLHTIIDHTFISQCEIYLSSPTHPNDFVHVNNGFCYPYDTELNLTFDDDGVEVDCDLTSTNQNVLPFEYLSVFNGQNQQGNWTLRVYDTWEGDDGTITDWGLEICSEVAALNLENSNLFDFMIFPNPSNGVFTIQFETNSEETITLNVHDLRGRQISTKKYINNGIFNETINLQVEKGVYFVTVSDGFKTGTKKIVIY